jgi:OCT family organic cation transporter-like MFS transporter 4/5
MIERTYPVGVVLEMAGNAHEYQRRMNLVAMGQWFFAAFIEMGFPLLLLAPTFLCLPGEQPCSEAEACLGEYRLVPVLDSVVTEFGLVCAKRQILSLCFEAFLIGGFLGSLWYGELIERKGRAYPMKEAMGVMLAGMALCLLARHMTVLGVGLFLVNFGFRGYANAVVNNLIEVSSDLWRQISPVSLSLGWALGQVTVGLLGIWGAGWRLILAMATVCMAVLWILAMRTAESPRFLVVKREYQEAKQAVRFISESNGRALEGYEFEE